MIAYCDIVTACFVIMQRFGANIMWLQAEGGAKGLGIADEASKSQELEANATEGANGVETMLQL